jgi:3-hydroxyacyl-CoA dehydrogenase/enoyl-CoA hydratase/3-hydroxybutyryl-CoA epimerase
MSTAAVSLDHPDEVVTHAHVRYVRLPGVGGPVALITLDNGHDHTRPNTFGPGGLRELLAAVDEIEAHDPPVAAVAVTGKPFGFCMGADLSFRSSLDPAEIRPAPGERQRDHGSSAPPETHIGQTPGGLGELGHAAFRRVGEGRLGDRRVPTFALVNGAALGGGLELALHCDYRALSSGIPVLALPEVFLGLLSAWGGTQLLPNLIGADRAVTVMIDNALSQNWMMKGPEAHALGLGDILLEPADFLEEALRWVGQVLRGEVDPTAGRVQVERGEAWAAALRRGRALADARLHGAAPGPYRVLELMALAETADRDTGYAAENAVLADLAASEGLAGLYAFELVNRPVGGPDGALARPVTKVGVVGAGLMAGQLALLFAQRLEVPVVLTDIDRARLDAGVGNVHREIDNLQLHGRISPDKANRLRANVTGSLARDAFADADLVVEAVFEDMKVKKTVLAELEAVVSPETLLLTTTSALSVTEMASGLAHPERVAGLHFFDPVAVVPLVEVVRGRATDDAAIATTLDVSTKLEKNAVLVADAPAFVVNRLLTRFTGEVLAAVETGTPIEEADAALDPIGLPMSPLAQLALVGPPVALHVAETLHEAFPDRFRSPTGLSRLVAGGRSGFYTTGPQGEQIVDPEAAVLVRGDGGTAPMTGEQVRTAALAALAQEIRLLLDEGVVAEAADIDLCMLLGAGWPFHIGGVTPYLDRTGISEQVTGRRFNPPGVATIF